MGMYGGGDGMKKRAQKGKQKPHRAGTTTTPREGQRRAAAAGGATAAPVRSMDPDVPIAQGGLCEIRGNIPRGQKKKKDFLKTLQKWT